MTPVVRPLRGALALSGPRLFAGGSDGRAYAFDKRTGGVLWSIPFDSPFAGQPVSKDGRVYFGSEDGTLLALTKQPDVSCGDIELKAPCMVQWL